MQARAQLSWTQVPAGAIRFFVVALFAAFMLGGTGGYLVRGLSLASSGTTTTTPHPFVVEQAPYSSPAASPASQPLRDPKGYAIPI